MSKYSSAKWVGNRNNVLHYIILHYIRPFFSSYSFYFTKREKNQWNQRTNGESMWIHHICIPIPYWHRFLDIFCFGFYQHSQLLETIMFQLQRGWFIPSPVELIPLPLRPWTLTEVKEDTGFSSKDKESKTLLSVTWLPTLNTIWREEFLFGDASGVVLSSHQHQIHHVKQVTQALTFAFLVSSTFQYQ